MLNEIDISVTIYSLLPLITSIPSIYFIVVFIQDAAKTKQRMFGYLIALFAVYLVQHFFYVRQYFITTEAEAKIAFLTTQILQIFIILEFSLIVEMFERNTPYTGKQMLFTSLAAFTIGTMASSPTLIVEPIKGTFLVKFDPTAPEWTFQTVFSLIAAVWLLFTISRRYIRSTALKQKNLMKGLFWGAVITILIGSTIPSLMDYMTTQGILRYDPRVISTLWNVLQDVGILIVGSSFLRISKNPWLLQRQQVYFILVLSKEGINLYSKAFRSEITPNDMTLFSGGFSAVTTMFQQATKTSSEVKSILFEGKELRLLSREHFLCAVLVDFSTQASEVAHQKFANDFEAMFREKFLRTDGEVTGFSNADALAELYFS